MVSVPWNTISPAIQERRQVGGSLWVHQTARRRELCQMQGWQHDHNKEWSKQFEVWPDLKECNSHKISTQNPQCSKYTPDVALLQGGHRITIGRHESDGLTNFYKSGNALVQNYHFLGVIHYLLNCYQLSIPCVNDTLVAVHGCESPVLIKDGPIPLNHGNYMLGISGVKVGDIQVLANWAPCNASLNS